MYVDDEGASPSFANTIQLLGPAVVPFHKTRTAVFTGIVLGKTTNSPETYKINRFSQQFKITNHNRNQKKQKINCYFHSKNIRYITLITRKMRETVACLNDLIHSNKSVM